MICESVSGNIGANNYFRINQYLDLKLFQPQPQTCSLVTFC